ncbi:hypothetical protein KTD08_07415 [Burkholderia multivorans]|uniref:hypothetical protein n=1 Tax=Burkholderia multivorans TaxID=87883 RepID=UPI001C242293|nr:hypothetical protein [Burkholderia multivorans]MBU9125029.1 hypothetical protein [Burkholderia multivorans]
MNDRTPVRINCDSDAFPYIEIGADAAFVMPRPGPTRQACRPIGMSRRTIVGDFKVRQAHIARIDASQAGSSSLRQENERSATPCLPPCNT